MRFPHFPALALCLSILGCTSERIFPPGGEESLVFLSSEKPNWSEEQEQTKTFWEKNSSIKWAESDKIKVLANKDGKWLDSNAASSSDGGGDFLISPTSVEKDTAVTSFAVPTNFLADKTGSWKFYGVYPPSCLLDSQMSGSDSFSFRILTRQTPVVKNGTNSFDPAGDVLFGHTKDIEVLQDGASYPMYWDRLVAHLCVNLDNVAFGDTEESLKSITFIANSSETLSGSFTYSLSSGQIAAVTAADSVEVVNTRGNLNYSNGKISDVWMSVLPQTITSLKVKITSDRAVYTKSWTKLSLDLKKNCRNTLSISMANAGKESSGEQQDDPYYTMVFDTTFAVSIPETVIASHIYSPPSQSLDIISPSVDAESAVDLHLEVFPMYAFGDGPESGDYYCVEGYLWSHNALFYADRNYRGVMINGWYPSLYALDFQLLTEEGDAMSGSDELSFLCTPEPSSTQTDWVYRKGFTISVTPQLTLGMTRPKLRREQRQWKTTFKGWITVGFNWTNATIQSLPDQTVLMYTDAEDRTVHYQFKTMNDETGHGNKYIPDVFKTDQRVDFSWVWHVKKGVSCAKDNDFGQMNLRVALKPTYKVSYEGNYVQLIPSFQEHYFEGWSTYEHKDREFTIEMPSINRIPVGKVNLKFDTLNEDYFLTDIIVYRQGEYASGMAYDTYNGTLDKGESANLTLRCGTYDITFTAKDSSDEDFRVVSQRIIRDITVESGSTKEIAYSEGSDI